MTLAAHDGQSGRDPHLLGFGDLRQRVHLHRYRLVGISMEKVGRRMGSHRAQQMAKSTIPWRWLLAPLASLRLEPKARRQTRVALAARGTCTCRTAVNLALYIFPWIFGAQ
jgi:hypothetical protein